MGHNLHRQIERLSDEALAEIDAFIDEPVAPRDLGFDDDGEPRPRWKLDGLRPNDDSGRTYQSMYATENRREWFAEAFADGMLNGDNASESGKRAVALVARYMGGDGDTSRGTADGAGQQGADQPGKPAAASGPGAAAVGGGPDRRGPPGTGLTYDEERQATAVEHYVGSGYQRMNDWLRHGTTPQPWQMADGTVKESAPEIADDVAAFRQLLDRSRTTEPKTLWRGAAGDWINDLTVGSTVTDNGFLSLTADEEIADGFARGERGLYQGGGRPGAVLHIDVPAGANAVDVNAALVPLGYELPGPGDDTESEWVMPPGSTLRIVEDLGDRNGIRHLRATVEGASPEPLPPSTVPDVMQAPSQPTANDGLTSIQDFAAPDSIYTAEEHGAWLLAGLPGRDGLGARTDSHADDFIHNDEAVAAKQEVTAKIAARMGDVPDDVLLDPRTMAEIRDPDKRWVIRNGHWFGPYNSADPVVQGGRDSGNDVVDGSDPRVSRMYREQVVTSLVSQWASTSNDSDRVSLAIQRAAVDEFGIEGAAEWDPDQDLGEQVDAEYDAKGEVYRAFVRAQYDETQAMFAKQGITELSVYRGMAWNERSIPEWVDMTEPVSDAEIPLRPMSSFSLDPAVAERFASHADGIKAIVTGTIPVSRVMATPRSGVGCLNEYETVILAGPGFWSIIHDAEQPLTDEEIRDTPAGMLTAGDMAQAIALAGSDQDRRNALISRARYLGVADLIPASWLDQSAPDVYDGADPATSELTTEEMAAAASIPAASIETARELAAAIMQEYLHPAADPSRRTDLRTLADSGRFTIPGLDLSEWE
jgi:hypothetical protein